MISVQKDAQEPPPPPSLKKMKVTKFREKSTLLKFEPNLSI